MPTKKWPTLPASDNCRLNVIAIVKATIHIRDKQIASDIQQSALILLIGAFPSIRITVPIHITIE